jgi:hypothetical protein
MIATAAFLAGAVFRRWWGGWKSPDAIAKRVMGYLLPFLVLIIPTNDWVLSGLVAAVVGTGWWIDFKGFDWLRHAYGQRMGYELGSPPLGDCYAAMATRYGSVALLAGLVMSLYRMEPEPLLYLFYGVAAPFGYVIGWFMFRTFNDLFPKDTNDKFIDGPTAIGECWLGALMIGGLAMVA